VLSGAARIALVPAVALFDPDVQPPTLKPGIVSLAAPSSSFAHMFALVDAPPGPGARIATGPVGSPSYGLARLAARWLPEDIELVPLDRTDAATAVEALVDGRADRALVLASLGRSDIDEVMATGQIRLEDWSGWLRGSAGLVLSFLRDAVIADGIYGPGQARTSTVSMQMVVVGPAPTDRVLGRAGPLTFSQDILPIPDKVVLDFNTHLGLTADVAPQLSPASVLAPRPLSESAPLNPDPGATALSMGILVFLIWAAWLLVRPPREEEP
jgi:osmoprotectant transport system permease protein